MIARFALADDNAELFETEKREAAGTDGFLLLQFFSHFSKSLSILMISFSRAFFSTRFQASEKGLFTCSDQVAVPVCAPSRSLQTRVRRGDSNEARRPDG